MQSFQTILVTTTVCLALLTGCAHSGNSYTTQKQSNLAEFLFGGNELQHPAQKVPLTLPAKVGVMFVPSDPLTANIPEVTKREAVEAVRSELAKHTKYIAGAHNIPSAYLIPKGGVTNLDQVAKQFDVDVIVILGGNQFQKHERNPLAAFMDITVVGMFVIPGTTVDTSTVLEAAVYHVPSRALVCRTDGIDRKKSRSSQFGSSKSVQNDAESSIEDASKKLVISIAEALAGFEKFDVSRTTEIKPVAVPADKSGNEQENYWGRVSQYRSTGGGSCDIIWIIMTGTAIVCASTRSKK
jgi:rhombotail lipoprotein